MSAVDVKRFGRTGVLMGGCSAEREVSLRSGAAVLRALTAAGVDAVGIDLQDDWAAQLREAAIDTAFIALHGTLGEDGCVQGMLEIMAIPYTGSRVMASALCMNKRVCKQVLYHAGLNTPVEIRITETGPERYPVFIKPVAEGSSVGLHYVDAVAAWQQLTLDPAMQWIAEMPVRGVEVAVSVLAGEALMPVEVAPNSGVYDYASKYTAGATAYYCPARLPAETLRYCMEQAEKAVAAAGCSGAPRVDMIVGSGGEVAILEINTIPGMTETSLLPKAAAAAGIDFQELCLRILGTAGLDYGREDQS